MTNPADQDRRHRFASELERNFSVVAAAGSGKTRAITDRIVQIALSPRALEWLPRLVVVTFTNRAADEMQRRARQKMLENKVSLEILAAFNRAFFGTIHSFCVKLLANHGHYLGLPSKLELIADDKALWHEFVQRRTVVGASLAAARREKLLRHVEVRHLLEMGRRGDIRGKVMPELEDCPPLDLSLIYDFQSDRRSEKKITRIQADLRLWEETLHTGTGLLPLPTCDTEAKAFVATWRAAFGPLRDWLNKCSLVAAAEIERDYREFRVERGTLTYDDQVSLAAKLPRIPEAARRIREKGYRVILDEAQDTDPGQFSLLLEIARPPEAGGEWPETGQHPPAPGRFCMVGDFQQSIFGDRAHLANYRGIHEAFARTGTAEELTFSVTFRLDSRQIEFINAAFARILNNTDGQVKFVHLHPRPDVLPGQVLRLELSAEGLKPNAAGKILDRVKAAHEAAQLAQWLHHAGLPRLRARSWRDVAILCPRKRWFRPLAEALRRVGIAVQVQSESEINGDSPAYAWFTALLAIMAEPGLSYEVVGVLREVFGLSDHDLAVFSRGDGRRFQVERTCVAGGPVSDVLNLLVDTRAAVITLPLFSAAREIVEATRLRERLRSLPAEDYPDLDTELDTLLTQAATAEAEGLALPAFAASLHTNFSAVREAPAPREDAVQLITCQKAKGSEWQAVIVPFLGRRIATRADEFPRLIRQPGTEDAVVALRKEDVPEELKDLLAKERLREMERLLYVALTRARHTLVLASDVELFANAKGEGQKVCQARTLQCLAGQSNEMVTRGLAALAETCEITGRRQQDQHASQREEERTAALPGKPDAWVESALSRAARFPRKSKPSALGAAQDDPLEGKLIEPELRPAIGDTAATRYGTWWHQFMESFNWRETREEREARFRENLESSPDVERSRHEWQLLQQHINTRSALGARLVHPDVAIRQEMPFLLRTGETACLEGIVDLAVFDLAAGKCLIIDWKTNRVAAGGASALRDQYKSQLAAYAQSLRAITGIQVEAGIYSTGLGAWLPWDSDELAEHWKHMQSELLAGEIERIIAQP